MKRRLFMGLAANAMAAALAWVTLPWKRTRKPYARPVLQVMGRAPGALVTVGTTK